MSTKPTAPPYSEAEATAWLAWLAFHMQQRDLTIFQIESLQPDWLTGFEEIKLYLLLTRTLWGMFMGLTLWLSSGVFLGLSSGAFLMLSDGLSMVLILGLSFGVLFGQLELVPMIRRLDSFLLNRISSSVNWVIGTIIFGLIFWLTFYLIFGLMFGVRDGLLGVLIFGLLGGLLRTSRMLRQEVGGPIQTIEFVQWSFQYAYQNTQMLFRLILIILLSIGFSGGVMIGGRFVAVFGWLILGLILGLITGLLLVLASGFRNVAQEQNNYLNQGMWLTTQFAVKSGMIAGLIGGIRVYLLSQDLTVGLVYGTMTSLSVGGFLGGLDAIEHGIIRLIITWWRYAPLNYVHFLDYAAEELNFLQKVGRGYVFIHHYLLEHFAEIAVEKGYVTPPAAKS